MHLHLNKFKPKKRDFLNSPTSSSSVEQILSSEKLHQHTYENFCAHDTRHTNRKHSFVNKAKHALDSSYLLDLINDNNSLQSYSIYESETDPKRPLIVPREALSTHDLLSTYTITNHQ